MSDQSDPTPPAVELEALANAVKRLRMDWQRPEPFFEERSEISYGLLRLARRLSGRPMPAPMPIPLRRPVPLRVVERVRVEIREVRLPARLTVRRRHRFPRPPADPRQVALL